MSVAAMMLGQIATPTAAPGPFVVHAPNADGDGTACGADAKPDSSEGRVEPLVRRQDRAEPGAVHVALERAAREDGAIKAQARLRGERA